MLSQKSAGDLFMRAFYGDAVPMSQYQPLSEEIVRVSQTIKADFRAKFADVTYDEVVKGICATLQMLRQLGATSPKAYLANQDYTNIRDKSPQGMAITAFAAGCSEVRELIAARRKAEQTAESKKEASRVQVPIHASVMDQFETYKRDAETNGIPFPALVAWKSLVMADFYRLSLGEGYAYFLVAWQIPQDFSFYDHEACIEVMNEHPRLHNRNPNGTFDGGLGGTLKGVL